MSITSHIKLRVIDFVEGTTVDGPGFRTSIYFAGCDHHCPHCHNPHTWDARGGKEMSIDEILEVIERNKLPVTFSGGDPIKQYEALAILAEALKERRYNVWCYTGFTYEQLLSTSKYDRLLKAIDVLVDGPFVNDLRDTSLLFRGSSNQRLIDIPSTMNAGKIMLWHSDF